MPVSRRRLAEEQTEIIAEACLALFDVTSWAGNTDTIEDTIDSYIQLMCKRGASTPEMKAAIDALDDEWMHRFCVHVRAERSTTLRPVDVWRQMRNWLGLPKAERKRQGSGDRKYAWQITAGSYQTLARNAARRLAVRQYRQTLEDAPTDTSTFCRELLPVSLLQKVDVAAVNAASLVEMAAEVCQIVRQWRAEVEAIPL